MSEVSRGAVAGMYFDGESFMKIFFGFLEVWLYKDQPTSSYIFHWNYLAGFSIFLIIRYPYLLDLVYFI